MLSIIRTGVDTILITLVDGDLRVVSIIAVLSILTVLAVATIAIIIPSVAIIVSITVATVIPISIPITTIIPIAITPIWILAVRPLRLNRRASHRAKTYQENHREQDFADPAFKII